MTTAESFDTGLNADRTLVGFFVSLSSCVKGVLLRETLPGSVSATRLPLLCMQ